MIYEIVKKICSDKGISIAELEKKAGLGNGTIGKWKNCSPGMKSLEAVAKVLEMSVADMLKMEKRGC